MYKYKVSRNFSSNLYSDSKLVTTAGTIVELMTDNPSFPTPVPSLELVTTANTNFQLAIEKTLNGGPQQTVLKNDNRTVLTDLLKQLSVYVQAASNGDEAIILSSGFRVNKRPTPIGPLPKPLGLQVEPGVNHGTIQLRCGVIKGASSYIFEYAMAPLTGEKPWQKVISTSHTKQINDLEPGKQYVFRVAGAGADPSRNWSDSVFSFVL